jgi:hypothetical protein
MSGFRHLNIFIANFRHREYKLFFAVISHFEDAIPICHAFEFSLIAHNEIPHCSALTSNFLTVRCSTEHMKPRM